MPRFTDSVCQCGLRSSSSSWPVAFYFIFKLARSGVDPRRDCRGEKTSCTQTPWHGSGTHSVTHSVIKPLITLISMKIAARQLGVSHSSTGGTGVVLQTSTQPASESTCTPCRAGPINSSLCCHWKPLSRPPHQCRALLKEVWVSRSGSPLAGQSLRCAMSCPYPAHHPPGYRHSPRSSLGLQQGMLGRSE